MKPHTWILWVATAILIAACGSNPSNPSASPSDATPTPAHDPISNAPIPVNSYSLGDTLYVYAKSGLVLRDKPDDQSTKLETVPLGDWVVVDDDAPHTVPYESTEPCGLQIRGHWVSVIHEGQSGYLFDGFLLRIPPQLESSPSDYWSRFSKEKSFSEKAPESDVAIFFYANILWENGVHFINQGFEGYTSRELTLPRTLFDFPSAYVWMMAKLEDKADNPLSCNCDETTSAAICETQDERYIVDFSLDSLGNIKIAESFAD